MDDAGLYGTGEARYVTLWPNSMLNILPGRLQTNRVIATGPNSCAVESSYYYLPGEEARADGKVITSAEVFVMATLATGTLILILGQWALRGLVAHWGSGLVIDSGLSLDTQMTQRTGAAVIWIVTAGVGLGFPMIVTIRMAQVGMGGLNFAPKALGFKPDKVNPLAGLKRMASMKSLVDLGKSTLKVIVLFSAAASLLWPLLPALMGSASLPPGDALTLFGTALIRVMFG